MYQYAVRDSYDFKNEGVNRKYIEDTLNRMAQMEWELCAYLDNEGLLIFKRHIGKSPESNKET